MSRTITRKPPPRRPVRRQPAKREPLVDRIVQKLPVSEAALRRAVTAVILTAGGAAAIAAAIFLGVPQTIGHAVADQAGAAGLRVEQVDITGLKRMDRETVYAIALEDQPSRAMLRLDLDEVRQRLLNYGWIEDAYVSRRLPDRLLIHVVEREPAAVWQDGGNLTLIDERGRLLAPVDAAAMPDLPLVIGPGADRQEAAYRRLLSAAPALKPRVRAATWVGNRRWDLVFDTGETLALPQEGAARALVRFAQMDGAQRLLGRGFLRFDMRDPTKLVARRPAEGEGQAIADDGRTPAPAPSDTKTTRAASGGAPTSV